MNTPDAPELTGEQLLSLTLLPLVVMLFAGIAATQILSAIARLQVGPVIAADRGAERRTRIVMTALIVVVLLWILADTAVWRTPVTLCLGAALLLVWTTPGVHTAVLGEGGVQRGAHARRFESLEEWRLTGDHLRFRLHGTWTSVPCPPERQAELRAKLVALVPERESPFQD